MSLLNPIVNILPDLNKAFLETIYMVGVSLAVALLIGLPLGVLLFTTTRNLFFENGIVNRSLGFAVNIVRSIPFHHSLGRPPSFNGPTYGMNDGAKSRFCFPVRFRNPFFCKDC